MFLHQSLNLRLMDSGVARRGGLGAPAPGVTTFAVTPFYDTN